jgi:membrane-bound lytic murein transglycosylase MltF
MKLVLSVFCPGKETREPQSLITYNAGRNRVAQLRKEAATRGLNPNVWFHNVEYVAAARIGEETVTYVSNIYTTTSPIS